MADSREECLNILDGLYDVIRLNNETHLIAREYADLKEGVGNQGAKLEVCQDDLAVAKNKADQLDSCITSRDSYQAQANTCSIDLGEQKKKGGSNPIVYGGIGAAVMWFMMRKKEAKPQEFEEFGGTPPMMSG